VQPNMTEHEMCNLSPFKCIGNEKVREIIRPGQYLIRKIHIDHDIVVFNYNL
jgi:hypothetical protein